MRDESRTGVSVGFRIRRTAVFWALRQRLKVVKGAGVFESRDVSNPSGWWGGLLHTKKND